MHHVHNLFNGYVQDALPVPQSRAARALFDKKEGINLYSPQMTLDLLQTNWIYNLASCRRPKSNKNIACRICGICSVSIFQFKVTNKNTSLNHFSPIIHFYTP